MEEYTPSTARAVELLLIYRNELFMLLRDDKPGLIAKLRWSLLAGGVEPGETPDQAMRREIKEEIGIDLDVRYIATTNRRTWYLGYLDEQHVGAIEQGEGCARGLFKFSALRGLARIGGEGGLGGTIERLMRNNQDAVYFLLMQGMVPLESDLASG